MNDFSPEKSASWLNQALDGLDAVREARDIGLALKEFALGTLLSDSPLCLGFGAAPIEPRPYGVNAQEPLVLCQALYRAGDSLILGSSTETSMAISTLLAQDSQQDMAYLDDAYAFGSVWLVSELVFGNRVFALRPTLAIGDQAAPLLMSRTISKQEALTCFDQLNMPPKYSNGTSGRLAVKLLHFLVDIDRFVEGQPARTEIKVHTIDLRRPRGYLGFAEESLAVSMIPPICHFEADLKASEELILGAMYNLIRDWIELPCWNADFLGFWASRSELLGEKLRKALEEMFNIVVP